MSDESTTQLDPVAPTRAEGLRRLRELYNHVKDGKRGHAVFNFGCFNADHEVAPDYMVLDPARHTGSCGTMGCLLGECPILWPDHWQFDGNTVGLRGDDFIDEPDDSAWQFFHLTAGEVGHLFYPECQLIDLPGKKLKRDSTREEVLENLLAFIVANEKQLAEYGQKPEAP